MKNYLTILLFTCQFVVFGQTDTIKLQKDTSSSDDLIYDWFQGETYEVIKLANGWRRSKFNMGNAVSSYLNLYVEGLNFKKDQTQPILYRYKNGRLFTGTLEDTLYNDGLLEAYIPPPNLELAPLVLLRGNCQDGLMHGKVTLSVLVLQNGVISNLTISECEFEYGEIVGMNKYWNVNSANYRIVNGQFEFQKPFDNISALQNSLELTEFIYVKGSSEWTQKTITKNNGEKITTNR